MKLKEFIDKYICYVLTVCILCQTIIPIICVIYDSDTSLIIFKIIRYACYLTLVTRYLYDYKKVTLYEITAILLSMLIFISTKNKSAIVIVLMIISCKYVDIKRLLKQILISMGVIFITTVLLSLLKIIPDWTYNRNGIIRHSLGFFYPTDCFSIYLILVLLFIYIKKRSSYIELLIMELLNIFLFVFTYGRLSFFLINIVLICVLLYNTKFYKNIINKYIKESILMKYIYIFPIILFILSFLLVQMFMNKNTLAYKTNDLLSNRIYYSSKALLDTYPTMFGQDINWHGWGGYGYIELDDQEFEYNFVDNSYVRIFIDYGIIPTVLILISYSYLIKMFYNEHKYRSVFIMLIVLMWSFVEPYIFNFRNIFIILFVLILKSKKNKLILRRNKNEI